MLKYFFKCIPMHLHISAPLLSIRDHVDGPFQVFENELHALFYVYLRVCHEHASYLKFLSFLPSRHPTE